MEFVLVGMRTTGDVNVKILLYVGIWAFTDS